MGKFNPNPQKLASVLQYFRSSRVAHSIKDLEKQLPAVASVNGMQVKDYLQALSDDSKIHVEKIGSGNWYWSFASEELKSHEQTLSNARAAHEKLLGTVVELRRQAEAVRERQREDEEVENAAAAAVDCEKTKSAGNVMMGRQDLMSRRAELENEVAALERELEGYKDLDPLELQRKTESKERYRTEAERFTDEIYAMEGWFKNMGQDEEGLRALREAFYGDQLDTEEGVLREL